MSKVRIPEKQLTAFLDFVTTSGYYQQIERCSPWEEARYRRWSSEQPSGYVLPSEPLIVYRNGQNQLHIAEKFLPLYKEFTDFSSSKPIAEDSPASAEYKVSVGADRLIICFSPGEPLNVYLSIPLEDVDRAIAKSIGDGNAALFNRIAAALADQSAATFAPATENPCSHGE